MGCSRKVFWAKAAVILGAVPVLIYAYEYGPDPGYTGAPGESTCANAGCHTGTVVNGGPGSVKVTFPGALTYTPGVKQHLSVTVADSGERKWGFQLTARLADGKTQAGTLAPTDNFTQVLCSTPPFVVQAPAPCPANAPLQYIEHSLSAYQAGKSTFEFDWTPPASDAGPVTLYVAGNAANGDLTNRGDHIYTASYTLTAASGGGGNLPTIDSVVNSASLQPGIQQGAWVTIKGSNLSTTPARIWRDDEIINGVLPTSLDGVSVKINGKPAAVYYISPTQLNVQSPSDDSLGDVPVTVTTSAGTSAAGTATLQSFAPAFFLWGGKYAVATHSDYTLAVDPSVFPGTNTVPARPGETIVLWGTGFGPTSPPMAAGKTVDAIYTLAQPPTVRVNGTAAVYVGGALTPGTAGLCQVAITIPDSTPDGDMPVLADFGSYRSPDGVYITVKR